MEVEQLGPYRIGRRIGRGGMGAVYEAVNQLTGEAAAVKILAPAFGNQEGFRHRFEAEIETLRKLNHPNIVRLFGFGQQGEHLYYAMELVDGTSLEDEIRQGRRFPWREVAEIGIAMSRALRHAHDRGVVHRDIKPANLLLDRDGAVKLSDFGIARLFGGMGLTAAGSVIGTVEYMPPEQADGRPVDPRSDLYSLGGVLYALLAGRPPLVGRALAEVIDKQRHEIPQPVRTYAPDTPEELEAILAHLLEKEPHRRPVNATLLAKRLQAMVHALSVRHDTATDPPAEAPPQTAEGETCGFQLRHSDSVPTPSNADSSGEFPSTRLMGDSNPPAVAVPPAFEPGTSPPASEAPREAAQQKGAATQAGESAPPSVEAKSTSTRFAVARQVTAGGEAATIGEAAPPADRFTAVAEEDLDRPATDEDHHPLISWQTWVLVAALLTLGGIAWWSFQPYSADDLYERIAARTRSGDTAALLDAEAEIREFLGRFPNDPRGDSLREDLQEIELVRLDRQMQLRLRGVRGGEGLLPVERDYLEAMNYLRLVPELGMARLEAIVDLYGPRTDPKSRSGQCVELARRQLEQIHRQLAAQAEERLETIHERLDQADRLEAGNPDQADAMRRAVVELFADKPWAAPAVARARAALRAAGSEE